LSDWDALTSKVTSAPHFVPGKVYAPRGQREKHKDHKGREREREDENLLLEKELPRITPEQEKQFVGCTFISSQYKNLFPDAFVSYASTSATCASGSGTTAHASSSTTSAATTYITAHSGVPAGLQGSTTPSGQHSGYAMSNTVAVGRSSPSGCNSGAQSDKYAFANSTFENARVVPKAGPVVNKGSSSGSDLPNVSISRPSTSNFMPKGVGGSSGNSSTHVRSNSYMAKNCVTATTKQKSNRH
jgi:hypothetical protein